MAFGEANLWSTIYVTNGSPGFPDLLQLWLTNSGSRSLKLVFRDGPDYIERDGDVVVAMLHLAAAHSHRWSTFKVRLRSLRLPGKGVYDALKNVETPNLIGLAYSFNWNPDVVLEGGSSFHDLFMETCKRLVKQSLRLREMQMWSTMDHDLDFLSAIPFPRLSVMTLPVVYILEHSRFLANLSHCACLRTLTISLAGNQPQSSPHYALAIPSLRNLNVIGFSTAHVNTFLRVFHLPSLQHLSVHTNSLFLPGSPLALVEVLDHWQPTLLSLELRDEQSSRLDLFFSSWARHPAVQSLIYLRVGGLHSANIFPTLTLGSPGPSLMPQLQRIHAETVHLGYECGGLTMMALSRSNPWSGLRLSVEADFLLEEELVRETEFWDKCGDDRLRKVDRRFRWIGAGERKLEREFMFQDFSMIQGRPSY
ncbi:hypothetical protein FA13DRAFT_1736227 [Coprinellus micaceus]|uniref:F-box domain-containing protein n=1 Tax=Coprinellus micaceus TaxID=71717 RepID=A0A4Y7T183_COPMI|nr:hypothetical protein FA13DRAFT_1736227 [Coprinellus micaceus]